MKQKVIRRNLRMLLTVTLVPVLALLAAPSARAQVPPAQTGAASPGRVEQQLRQNDLIPRAMPRVEVKESVLQDAPPGAEKISFMLKNLEIDGVSVYGESSLETVYRGSLGQTITLADLYGIAASLTRKYRNDGSVLTQVVVPPQTIEDETARLKVVEGFIDNVTVRGTDDESALRTIRAYADRTRTGGSALNVADLERSLLLINDLPGVHARGVLSPSKTTPGAADLLVIVERKPFDIQATLDNYGTRWLGPVQAGIAGSLNSLFGFNERITLQGVYAPKNGRLDSELAYAGFQYEQPVLDNGTSVTLFGNTSHTDPGYLLDQFDVEGRSKFGGFRVSHPFVRTRSFNATGRMTFDMRGVTTANNVEDTRRDKIHALRIGSRFDFLDTVFGSAYNVFDIEASRGLSLFGASEQGDDNMSRSGADPQSEKLTAEFQRLQRLTSSFNLLMGVSGQWASDAQLSSEEFGVGGMEYGRGFDSSEIVGDNGVAGKLEVQWNDPYKLDLFSSYQMFGFFDFGKVWNTDAAASAGRTDTATSAGFGIHGRFSDTAKADVMVAFPLDRNPQTQSGGHPRLFVGVSQSF